MQAFAAFGPRFLILTTWCGHSNGGHQHQHTYQMDFSFLRTYQIDFSFQRPYIEILIFPPPMPNHFLQSLDPGVREPCLEDSLSRTGRSLRIVVSAACSGKGCLGEQCPWGWIFMSFGFQETPRGSADGQVHGTCPDYYFAILLKAWVPWNSGVGVGGTLQRIWWKRWLLVPEQCTHKISIQFQKGTEFPWSSWWTCLEVKRAN